MHNQVIAREQVSRIYQKSPLRRNLLMMLINFKHG